MSFWKRLFRFLADRCMDCGTKLYYFDDKRIHCPKCNTRL